jgi:hypothetical protein
MRFVLGATTRFHVWLDRGKDRRRLRWPHKASPGWGLGSPR